MTDPYGRAGRVPGTTFVVMALLVTTHLGEFWPFSIFPMFSQGGKPWIPSHVREVEVVEDGQQWLPVSNVEALPGIPYALDDAGINQNDMANFLFKSKTWDAARVAGMRRLFGDDLDLRNLLIYRVDGRLADLDSVEMVYTPFLFLTPESTYFNPNLSYPMH